jgi:hypothetical protein
MKRTRAQNPKLQDPQDPSSAAAPTPKPQRKAKQPRQPKAAGTKKTSAAAAAREAAAAAAAAAAAPASTTSVGAEMATVVPDVVGGAEVAGGGLPADWDEMDGGGNGSPWWTFGVEEEKLLGWFPFVEEDFGGGCHGGVRAGEHEAAGFDDDIWRIHQIYEIPSYAAK